MANKKALKLSLEQMLAEADATREGAVPEVEAPEPDPAPEPHPTRASPKAIAPAPAPPPAPEVEASRPVSVQFFLADKDRDRLKRVGLDTRMSLNAICHEALSAWLETRGLPPLEWTAANFPSGRRPKG